MALIEQFTWSRGPFGYECSSRGDRRFSALFAVMPDGRTIEQHYQCDVKGYDPGGKNWRLGKGKLPIREVNLWREYLNLWSIWAEQNPIRVDELGYLAAEHDYVLSDSFATTPVNQAHALATILNQCWIDDRSSSETKTAL